MKTLYMNDLPIGEYSYGLYSKVQINLIKKDSHGIPVLDNYFAGKAHYQLGINVYECTSKEEIITAIEVASKMNINAWIESIFLEEINN